MVVRARRMARETEDVFVFRAISGSWAYIACREEAMVNMIRHVDGEVRLRVFLQVGEGRDEGFDCPILERNLKGGEESEPIESYRGRVKVRKMVNRFNVVEHGCRVKGTTGIDVAALAPPCLIFQRHKIGGWRDFVSNNLAIAMYLLSALRCGCRG